MTDTSAKATVVESTISTVTVSVEETVETLAMAEPLAIKQSKTTDAVHRDLPIFSNPLLANATQANSIPIKPKSGRVKVGGKTVQVLRLAAPKVDGEIVVMRRMDTDLVNANSMFKAAFPAISDKMEAKESAFVARKYEAVVEKSGAMTGVWLTITQARELSKEYEIDQFMRPLLDAPNPSTTKDSSASGSQTDQSLVVTEVTMIQTTEETIEEQQTVEETAEQLQELTVADVVGMKRRIEELEDQASRDQKKFRGLVTVAVGLAAATVIPQVLPYFS